jgi:PTH2 family peptidyl-tRNA hydrolase
MLKQVIIVRKDLDMTCGKVAGQVAHAAIMAMDRTGIHNSDWVAEWKNLFGQIKVILKVSNSGELNEYFIAAMNAKLPVIKVHDAGRTQIEPNTITCIGIGPVPAECVDPIIKNLKLL